MKLLITGDWHLSKKQPRNRIDDFFSAQKEKIKYILDYAKNHEVDYILQPGDFFNTHRAPDDLKRWIISELIKYKIQIITVYGQHDLRFHSSNKDNTPLAVLESAKVVCIVGPTYPNISIIPCTNAMVSIYGSSWNEPIPELSKELKSPLYGSDPTFIKIWITHRMVIENKLWDQQTEYELGHALLKRTPFDLIVSGDNHESFRFSTKNQRTLINCGSLMRDSINQRHHKPHFWILDVDKWEFTQKYIPIKDFKEVMNIEQAEEEKEKNLELETFIEGLKEDVELHGMDFKRNLVEYIKREKLDEGIINIINEVMEE